MKQNSLAPSERRKFLYIMLGGIGAIVVSVSAWPIWRFLLPADKGGEAAKITIARADVPLGQAHFFDYRGQPAVLLQHSPGDFSAFSAVCTHLGCIVQWQAEKNEFLCPCHAGRFGTDGQVLGGPPPLPLDSLPVAVEGDQLVVG